MKYNPISKTYFQHEKGKVQHYADCFYKCKTCGSVFRPKILSQSFLLQLCAGVLGVAIFAVTIVFVPDYLYVFVVFFVLYAFLYSKKKRRTISSASSKTKYGDIILECTKCNSSNIVKNEKS